MTGHFTGQRAGHPATDLIKAIFAWLLVITVTGVVIAVLSVPTLMLMGAVVLWVLTFTGVGL